MPKNWRMKFVKENNGPPGRDPEYGAIFMSNSSTRKECLKRGLFGLPHNQADFVKQVKHGMVLFLFDYESRELHGVFQASSDGAINIVSSAFCSSGKQFPAQVKFIEIWHCRPLRENEFRDAIRENYFSGYKFNFGLSEVQVQRLLKLFSFKKLERSSLMRTMVGQHTSDFSNANSRNPVKDGRLTALCSLGCEPDGQEYDTATGNEQPGDASGEFRRLIDHRVPGAKDLLGNECGMHSNFGRDATVYSRYSLNTNIRVPENLRYAESGRPGNKCHDKDDFAQVVSTKYPSLWSNLNQSAERGKVSMEADPQVLVPRRVALEPPSATNRENCNLSYTRLMRDASIQSSVPYDPDVPYLNSMDLSSSAASPNLVSASGQRFNSCGGYVFETLPLENVQPFPDRHSGASKHMTADFGLGDYVPLPGTVPDYPTSTSMIGVQPFPDEHSGASEHRAADFGLGDYVPLPSTPPDYPTSTSMIGVGHSGLGDYVPLPGTVPDYPTSTSMIGRQPFPDEHSGTSEHRAADFGLGDYVPLPSTPPDYPTSSSMIGVGHSEAVSTKPFQNISSKDRSYHLPCPDVLTSAESGENMRNFKGLSYSSSPSIYPSFLPHLPSSGVDLPPKERVNCEIPAYRSRHDFRDGAPDFNNRAGWIQDHVNRAAPETQSTRRSVFSRLALPPKEYDTKRGTSQPDESQLGESVDEVMAFLHECREHWLEQKKLEPHTKNLDAVRKFEMKKQKTRTADLIDDDPVSPAETALNDVLACEESLNQPIQRPLFIDFKRRSERQKSLGNLSQVCKGNPDDSVPQPKKRKLVRPKLIEVEPSMEKGNHDNPVENVSTSYTVCENKVETGEVPFMKPVDMESKNHLSQDGNTDGHNEELFKREEAKEDALTH